MENLIIVTGGAGFIGSNFVLQWIAAESSQVVNFDKLTYAGNLNNLRAIENSPRYRFEQGDIVDRDFVSESASAPSAARDRSFCGREPRRSVDSRAR